MPNQPRRGATSARHVDASLDNRRNLFRSETSNPLPTKTNTTNEQQKSVRDFVAASPIGSNAHVRQHRREDDEVEMDFDDIKLAPVSTGQSRSVRCERIQCSTPERRKPETDEIALGVVREDGEVLSQEQRLENSRDLYNQSSGLYPRERHYPTLEAMQRLNKIFGYVAIAIVFPYLIGRLIYLIYSTETGLLLELGKLSEFAIPVLFATVGLVGFLFASAEGIQLFIDVQDNLLRIANRTGRRKN